MRTLREGVGSCGRHPLCFAPVASAKLAGHQQLPQLRRQVLDHRVRIDLPQDALWALRERL